MIDTVKLMMIGEDGVDFKFLNCDTNYDSNGNIKMKIAYKRTGNTVIFINYDAYNKRLYLNFSIPQLLKGNNVENIAKEDLKLVIPKLREVLEGVVEVDFSVFELCRIDISYTFQMSKPAKEYIDLLSLGSFNSYLKEWKREGQTITEKNKRRSITFYDKYEQMKKKKYFDINLINPNYLRIELSLKIAKSIRDFFKLKSNLKFTKLLTSEFMEKSKALLLKVFDKEIYPSIPSFLEIEEDKQIIEGILADGRTRNLISLFALEKFKNQENGTSYLRKLFEGYLDPSNIAKSLNKQYNKKSGKSGSSKLLNEIREKIIAIG